MVKVDAHFCITHDPFLDSYDSKNVIEVLKDAKLNNNKLPQSN